VGFAEYDLDGDSGRRVGDWELVTDQVLIPWLVVEIGMRESDPDLDPTHGIGTAGGPLWSFVVNDTQIRQGRRESQISIFIERTVFGNDGSPFPARITCKSPPFRMPVPPLLCP
jgi:hypothetical protein